MRLPFSILSQCQYSILPPCNSDSRPPIQIPTHILEPRMQTVALVQISAPYLDKPCSGTHSLQISPQFLDKACSGTHSLQISACFMDTKEGTFRLAQKYPISELYEECHSKPYIDSAVSLPIVSSARKSANSPL